MLKQLTQDYIQAFDKKDLEKIESMLHKDFTLCDPEIKKTSPNGLHGKNKCLDVIKNIFNSCKDLTFKAKNIYVCENISIIEFSLQLDDLWLEGVDIIEWEKQDGVFVMKALRAYLDMPKG